MDLQGLRLAGRDAEYQSLAQPNGVRPNPMLPGMRPARRPHPSAGTGGGQAMMKQTANLRFIKRQVDKDVYRILQQQWIDDDPPDEGATRSAWRDVPTAEEQDAVPPPQVDSATSKTKLPEVDMAPLRAAKRASDARLYHSSRGPQVDSGREEIARCLVNNDPN